jgi:hypothetical protein
MHQHRKGALGLPFDVVESPPGSMTREAPEWINNKTWYHGTGVPDLRGEAVDPMKTRPEGLFGRGFYATSGEDVAKSYRDKGLRDAVGGLGLGSPEVADDVADRAAAGEFADYFSRNRQPVESGWGQGDPTRWHPGKQALYLIEAARLAARHDPLHQVPPIYREAYDLVTGGRPLPRPVVYQFQPDFGKVLDLESGLSSAKKYRGIASALRDEIATGIERSPLMPSARAADLRRLDEKIAENSRAMTIDRLIQGLVGDGFNVVPGTDQDPIVRALRQLGYDAMTHTGGQRAGGGDRLHQVVIALDPNDKLGLGRRTPFRQWEELRG